MRTFFCFRIKKEIKILTRETPYNLFKTIMNLYYLDNYDNSVSFNIYKDIFSKLDKEYIDNKINNLFKNNKHYVYNNEKDIHEIHNKYTKEDTLLKVYKSHIIIKTNMIKPNLLFNYLDSDDLFVCDFKNKDYFWLNELVR